ncbi:hypothetical protein NQZ79_g1636 [Umbelopsis isabellina]|nr:hypothetical protein NQZ79_g1636 [Umbelopsis isabellina]
MDSHILKLAKKPDHSELEQYLQQQGPDKIASLLGDILKAGQKYGSNNDTDPILVFRAVFIGSPIRPGDEQALERRLVAFMVALSWLINQVPDKSAPADEKVSSLANFLLPEIDSLPVDALRDVNSYIVEVIRKGDRLQSKIFDLIPKLLATAITHDTIEVEIDGKLQPLSGNEYVEYIIDKIISCKWHPSYSVGMASAFNEMDCTGLQLQRITDKLLSTHLPFLYRQLNVLELNELPPLAYQLFLLSRKGEKQGIIAGICHHFQDAEEKMVTAPGKSTNSHAAVDFNRVEGTIIVHMCFAIKQDQELGSEFLKYIKKHKSRALNSFTLACMLSMARIHRFEDTVLELLKSTIVSVYKDAEKLEQYPWLKEAESLGLYKVSIKDMMNVVITKASSGWDQVTQSLVQLGVLLIDTSVSSSPFKKPSGKSGTNLSPTEETCKLAIEILQKTFKLHDIVRQEIMTHILSRVVTRASSVMYFLDLLGLLVKECPQILMEADNMSKIRETLDYLSFLPLNSAKQLLETLHPIIQRDNRLKEALMLILRKGIFAKAAEGRQIAVHGLLLIINSNGRQSGSSSPPASNATALEILGLLRRCFSQQPEIRQLVYQNLSDIAGEKSDLASDILGMLQTQFQKYYVTDQGTANPLLLDKCVEQSSTGGNVHIAEPIHSLVRSLITTMTILKRDRNISSSSLSSLTGQIRSLCFRLSKSEPEDYELDKSSNYDMISNVGMRNKCRAQLLLGCYEAAIDYLIHVYAENAENPEIILKIFNKLRILHGILKEKATNEKGRKFATALAESSTLTLGSMTMLSKLIFTGRQHSSNLLRSNAEFMKYILSITQYKLSKLSASTETLNDTLYESLVSLANVYMEEVIALVGDKDEQPAGENATKASQELSLSVECLVIIPQLIHQFYPEKLKLFLVNLLQAAQASQLTVDVDMEILIKHFIMILQELIEDLVTHPNLTESGWIESFCVDRAIEDPNVAKAALSLLIKFSEQQKHFENIQHISNDINAKAGEWENDNDTQHLPTHYMIINNGTFHVTTQLLFSFLEHEYDGIEWVMNRLRLSGELDMEGSTAQSQFERSVCERIKIYMAIQTKLAATDLREIVAENYLKSLTKCYKALLSLVRLKLGTPAYLSPDFCDVVTVGANRLTDNMYKFLTAYGQRCQEIEEHNRNTRRKGKGTTVNSKEKAKIIRESKLIPNLIYVVEQYEGNLIKLSKKSKVNLTQNMKRSTARDFRIMVENLPDSSSSDEEVVIKRTASQERSSGEESKDKGPMSFTLPNVFRHSKSRLASKESQKDRQLSSESTSPPRPRTLSIASSHSPYSGPRLANSLESLWPSQPPRAQVVDTDELEANPFFITFQSLPYFHIFLRSALVCIPQAQSITGLSINKGTIETHAFLPSPFYKGQFQSLNGKVVSIEKGYVTEVAGFKQLRTIRILNEETHYTQGRKIRVLTIDRPLEGEIKEACKSLKEYEHFQELVENYILGMLHPKIWHKFLPPYLGTEDQSMAAICTAYRREITVLGSYGLSSHLKEIPISYLDAAVLCLRRLDSDDEMPDFVANTEEGLSGTEDGGKEPELATTPLEKLMCLRTSLSLLSAAADKYMQENRLTVFHTSVASDDLILLLACALTQTHLPRLMSTLFYIRHFHLNQVDRPELSYALVTFIAAIEFLRKDELSVVTPQTNAPIKHHSPYVNSRFNTSWSSLPNHYRSTSLPDRNSPESPSGTNIPATSLPAAKTVHHRKSRSTDLGAFFPAPTSSNDDRSRRTSMSPNVTIRPQIVIPNVKESKPKYSRNLGHDQHKIYSSRHDASEHSDRQLSDAKPMISTTSPTISTSTPLISSQSMNSFFPETSQQQPPSASSMKPTKPKLERSLSSLSSRSTPNRRTHSPGMHQQPPEIIRVSFDNSMGRPGSNSPGGGGLNRRPVSMYSVSDLNDSELMGDFLSGLQNDSDYVGDRAGRFRQVGGRW